MHDSPLTLLERLQHRFARTLLRLPPGLQILLSGKARVERDGLRLHHELQLLLSLRERLGATAMSSFTPEHGRRRVRREALMHAGEPVEVGEVKDLVLDTPHGPLKARHYAPAKGAGPRPLLVFLHGGGFVLCDLDTHDSTCRLLCRHAEVHLLSIDYRLAPEHPFPAALDDARAAFAWACANAEALGADPTRVAIGGDSAGGNLSASVSQLCVREGARAPALQFLLYPAVDRTVEWPSMGRFSEGFFLTKVDIDWFTAQYSGGQVDFSDPRFSPLVARELAHLPPALVITAGFDPLRDEGEAYVAALQKAGTPAKLRRFEGMVHGFANMAGVSRACRDAVVEIASMLRQRLDEVPSEAARTGARA
jgi:acetyl esterase